MSSHAELVAAVEKARLSKWSGPCLDCQACDDGRPDDCTDRCLILGADHVNAHLDTLAAILNLHTMGSFPGREFCEHCTPNYKRWPCPTVDLVADALRKMGASNDVHTEAG